MYFPCSRAINSFRVASSMLSSKFLGQSPTNQPQSSLPLRFLWVASKTSSLEAKKLHVEVNATLTGLGARSLHRHQTAQDSACTAQIIQIICVYYLYNAYFMLFPDTWIWTIQIPYPSQNLSVTSSKAHPLLRTWNEALPATISVVYKARWARFGGLALPLPADLNIT